MVACFPAGAKDMDKYMTVIIAGLILGIITAYIITPYIIRLLR